jgi:protein SCO1
MKLHLALLILCASALAAVIAATVVHHNQASVLPAATSQVFQVKGQIRSLESDGKTVRIAHEAIPGFMPAMEMPFTVKDPQSLRGLALGDTVKFDLVVTKDDSWIDRIEKTTAAPSTAPPLNPSADTASNELEIGQPVPDFALVDQNGHPFHLQNLRGKAVVLAFIYTRCPLPNFCPLMSKNFASLQERFAKDLPGKVQLLSISFDPQFDTPAQLKQYASVYQKEDKEKSDKDWLFATGTREQVDYVTAMFGLIREPANGFINHDLRTALISPDGKLVHVWRSNVWTPYEVQRMVRETVQPELAGSPVR